jgi:tetratricopeptide (TPR) repeat protein
MAGSLGNLAFVGYAENNLAQFYRVLGHLKEALAHAKKALPFIEQTGNRVTLSKLQWSIGDILRERGRLVEAAEAYRVALIESQEIGTRNDSAAIHLVLAEVLLDLGFNEEAEQQVRAALPIIEEEKMVPEGYAALALLQESLRRRKIDRQALRNLHGFFRDEQA